MTEYQAQLARAMILGLVILAGLQWALGDWMASIEARLWFLSIMGEF